MMGEDFLKKKLVLLGILVVLLMGSAFLRVRLGDANKLGLLSEK